MFRRLLAALFLAALMLPASSALSVPNCGQVNTGFCLHNNPNCIPWIEWRGSCVDETRQWRCWWPENPLCLECDCYGSWTSCLCVGGGCDCLVQGTPITMADGTTKPINEVRQGDLVLAFSASGKEAISRSVIRVHKPYMIDHYVVINGEIGLTENHPVLVDERWVAAGDLRRGDALTNAAGDEVPINDIVIYKEEVFVYNIEVDGGTYIASGVVVHNKEDCEIYEQRYPE